MTCSGPVIASFLQEWNYCKTPIFRVHQFLRFE